MDAGDQTAVWPASIMNRSILASITKFLKVYYKYAVSGVSWGRKEMEQKRADGTPSIPKTNILLSDLSKTLPRRMKGNATHGVGCTLLSLG